MVNEKGIFMKKKKVSLWFVVLGAILSGYAGYLLNGAWEPGGDLGTFLSSFNRVCAAPFANYYNERTVKAVVIALVVYAAALLMYVTSQRNFLPGKEFGTARFESPKFANKILMDKDENFNRILSQNVKMSLDFRRLKLNGNILICGGSGAGGVTAGGSAGVMGCGAAGTTASTAGAAFVSAIACDFSCGIATPICTCFGSAACSAFITNCFSSSSNTTFSLPFTLILTLKSIGYSSSLQFSTICV